MNPNWLRFINWFKVGANLIAMNLEVILYIIGVMEMGLQYFGREQEIFLGNNLTYPFIISS